MTVSFSSSRGYSIGQKGEIIDDREGPSDDTILTDEFLSSFSTIEEEDLGIGEDSYAEQVRDAFDRASDCQISAPPLSPTAKSSTVLSLPSFLSSELLKDTSFPEELKARLTKTYETFFDRCLRKKIDWGANDDLSEGEQLLRDGHNKGLMVSEIPDLYKTLGDVVLEWNQEHSEFQGSIISSSIIRNIDNARRRAILKQKHAFKKYLEKGKNLFEKEQKILAIKLRIAEKKGCPPEMVSDSEIKTFERFLVKEAAAKAHRIGEELIKEEAQRKTGKRRGGRRGRPRRARRRGARRPVRQVAQTSQPATEVQVKPRISRKIPIEELKGQLILSLYKTATRYSEAERVTKRWKTKDCSLVREFVDINKHGSKVQRYLYLSDDEISKQRARHYLPGIDRILSNKTFRDIYAFPSQEGFGLMGEINYGDYSEHGVVYVGIDGKKIYHRYFESMVHVANRNIFTSPPVRTSEPLTQEGWVSKEPFAFAMNSRGVLTLSYPGEKHSLSIHPLRVDLLDRRFLV